MLNRAPTKAKASVAFTPLEIDILNRLAPGQQPPTARPPSLQTCVAQLARLGGYLNRAGDGPPGNLVIWCGMPRLTDIKIRSLMAAENVGN